MRKFFFKPGVPNPDLRAYLAGLKPNSEYIITIKKNIPIRSITHNRYYRACLKIIAIHTGHSEDELHDLFKLKFNYEEWTFPNGEVTRAPKTTKHMTVDQFCAYVDQVKHFAIETWATFFPEKKDLDYKIWMDIDDKYQRSQLLIEKEEDDFQDIGYEEIDDLPKF